MRAATEVLRTASFALAPVNAALSLTSASAKSRNSPLKVPIAFFRRDHESLSQSWRQQKRSTSLSVKGKLNVVDFHGKQCKFDIVRQERVGD